MSTNKFWLWSVEKEDWIKKDIGEENSIEKDNNVLYCNEGIDIVNLSDLIKLVHLHEPAIYNSLRVRYFSDKIYTYTGPILLAINPYKTLNIYGREYTKLEDKNEPHIYQTASRAYKQMVESGMDQSVLISGESGAGKTVSTKFVMNYLTEGGGDICGRILQSNPILEAFGNASTLRNKNSSRFGKFIKLWYNKNSEIVGASIKTYLLEKIRLIRQGVGEFNFHIFYQLGLYKVSTDAVNDFHSSKCLDETLRAFKDLSFSDEKIGKILNCVKGLAGLGKVLFQESGGKVVISRKNNAVEFCKGMGGAYENFEKSLEYVLTHRRIDLKSETVVKNLDIEQALYTRNSLAMYVYLALFKWIVKTINLKLSRSGGSGENGDRVKFIGILDIFGFEVFDHNSLEQLFINYTNERLQELFNDYIFKLEEKEYKAEKIYWNPVDFPDNKECLELFVKYPTNVFSLLNEECRIPNGNDKNYYEKLRKSLEINEEGRFVTTKKQRVDGIFTVKHYAGKVEYNCNEFCDKNRDLISKDVQEFLKETDIWKLICNGGGFKGEGKGCGGKLRGNGGNGGNGRATVKKTVSDLFTEQLDGLISIVRKTQLHYIRCLKPNDEDRCDTLVPIRFIDQLRYCGVLEAVKVARAGFPIRFEHNGFVKRYRCLTIKENMEGMSGSDGFSKLCEKLLPKVSCETYQVGETKIFMKKHIYDDLEDMRLIVLNKLATKIRAVYIGWMCWIEYIKVRCSVILLQTFYRCWKARCVVKEMKMLRARGVVISFIRFVGDRCMYLKKKNGAVLIQRVFRRFRIKLRKYCLVFCFIENICIVRVRKRLFFERIVKIQCCLRRKLARLRLKQLKIEARSFNNLQKKYDELKEKYDLLMVKCEKIEKDRDEDKGYEVMLANDLKNNVESVDKLSVSKINIKGNNEKNNTKGETGILEGDFYSIDSWTSNRSVGSVESGGCQKRMEKIYLDETLPVIPAFNKKLRGGEDSNKRLIKDLRKTIKDMELENERKDKIIKSFDQVRTELAEKMERIYMVSEERKLELSRLKSSKKTFV